MALLDWVTSVMGRQPRQTGRISDPAPLHIVAMTIDSLGSFLDHLDPGNRAYITLEEHRRLFVSENGQSGFGEEAERRLAEFADAHGCEPLRVPAEFRVYFKRK
jgi:hypothetical protein